MPEKLKSPWKATKDIRLVREITLPPRGYRSATVLLELGTLPPGNLDYLEIRDLKTSGKSRLAQLGVVPGEETPHKVASTVLGKSWEGLPLESTLPVDITLHNFAARPIMIEGGRSVGRFYRPGEPIIGEELMDLISSGGIRLISSRNGSSRMLFERGEPKKHASKARAVAIQVEPGRKVMPFKMDPLNTKEILDAGENYREILDPSLIDAVDTTETILWIGNTSVELEMIEGVDAVIDSEVYAGVNDYEGKDVIGRHINARLLDGGKLPWPIRTEVLGRNIRNGTVNHVVLRFVRANVASQGDALRA